MSDSEKEFELWLKKANEFKLKLAELMKNYRVGIHESDNYDGGEEYCGTNYYFKIDGEVFYDDTVQEIIEQAIKHV